MRVYLDDKPVAAAAPESAAASAGLAQAIEMARRQAGASGRVIVEAKLDGRDLGNDELAGTVAAAGEELRCVSADPHALVAYSLAEVAASIPDMRAAQRVAAEKLQVGEFEPALTQLSDAIKTWETIRRVIDEGPRLLGLDARTLTVSTGGVGAEIDQLAAALSAVQSALRSQDWVGLADVLEGEMEPVAVRWEGLLGELSRRFAGTGEQEAGA